MQLTSVSVDILNNAEYNPRKDLKPTDAEYVKLKNSIEHFGYVEPIIVNKIDNIVVGGHQRLKVLKDLGYKSVDVVYVELNKTEEKALNIALNKISGDWDAEKLEDLLRDISLDTDFDVELTGFTLDEVETLFNGAIDDLDDKEYKEGLKQGKENRESAKGNLALKFGGISPFSILDTTKKEWKDRKKYWLDLGIKSELGRKEGMTYYTKGYTPEKYGISRNSMCSKDTTSIFDPVLTEISYLWFNIKGGSILDPFAGGSVRGIIADKLGYKYTGIELRKEQVEANYENANELDCTPKWICDDSREMNKYIDDNSMDMIFTCPPYADLEVYSDDKRDISNKEYPEFLELYTDILVKASNKLKNNRFFVIVIGEVRGNNGEYYNFVGDTINILKNKCNLQYYNEIILVNSCGTLPIRAGRSMNKSRKIGKRHQNILVFYKGDNKNIENIYGSVIDEEELQKIIEEAGELDEGNT